MERYARMLKSLARVQVLKAVEDGTSIVRRNRPKNEATGVKRISGSTCFDPLRLRQRDGTPPCNHNIAWRTQGLNVGRMAMGFALLRVTTSS
jgi:hypothetical protein